VPIVEIEDQIDTVASDDDDEDERCGDAIEATNGSSGQASSTGWKTTNERREES